VSSPAFPPRSCTGVTIFSCHRNFPSPHDHFALRAPQLQYLTAQLDELSRRARTSACASSTTCSPVLPYDGRRVINLASNNYLGCAITKAARAAIQAIRDYGVAPRVRTIAGTMKIHMELEEKIASFKNVEACVVFQSGFTANAGTVSAILGKEDFIVSDELNHAPSSTCPPLRAKIKVFRHKDVTHAEELLREIQNEPGRKTAHH